jgi:hypothetical protein
MELQSGEHRKHNDTGINFYSNFTNAARHRPGNASQLIKSRFNLTRAKLPLPLHPVSVTFSNQKRQKEANNKKKAKKLKWHKLWKSFCLVRVTTFRSSTQHNHNIEA